ncbi:hypothetical protein E2320_009388, partial [Naja naja]
AAPGWRRTELSGGRDSPERSARSGAPPALPTRPWPTGRPLPRLLPQRRPGPEEPLPRCAPEAPETPRDGGGSRAGVAALFAALWVERRPGSGPPRGGSEAAFPGFSGRGGGWTAGGAGGSCGSGSRQRPTAGGGCFGPDSYPRPGGPTAPSLRPRNGVGRGRVQGRDPWKSGCPADRAQGDCGFGGGGLLGREGRAGQSRSEPRWRVRAASAAPGARARLALRRSGYFRAGRFLLPTRPPLGGGSCTPGKAAGVFLPRSRERRALGPAPAAALPIWSRASQEGGRPSGRPLKIAWAAAGRIRDGGCAAPPHALPRGPRGPCVHGRLPHAGHPRGELRARAVLQPPAAGARPDLPGGDRGEGAGLVRPPARGLTAHDPCSLAAVPEYSLPDLVNLGDSWVFAITRNHNRVSEAPAGGRGLLCGPHLLIEQVRIPRDKLVGRSRPGRYSHILDELYKANVLPPTARKSRIGVLFTPQPDGTADMHIVINGEDMGPSARGLPRSRPLYAVVDIFASTKSVRIIQVEYGLPSLETLCRTAIQRHISHRLAIDGLNLPPLLKNLCKYE